MHEWKMKGNTYIEELINVADDVMKEEIPFPHVEPAVLCDSRIQLKHHESKDNLQGIYLTHMLRNPLPLQFACTYLVLRRQQFSSALEVQYT